jgi:hypothetical protein
MPHMEKKDQERGMEGAMIVWGEGEEPNKTTAKKAQASSKSFLNIPYTL